MNFSDSIVQLANVMASALIPNEGICPQETMRERGKGRKEGREGEQREGARARARER